jgi:hypothetical protein
MIKSACLPGVKLPIEESRLIAAAAFMVEAAIACAGVIFK